MRFKLKFYKIIAFIVAIAQFLPLLPVATFASSSEELRQQEETIVQEETTLTENLIQPDDMSLKSNRELKVLISKEQYSSTEKIPIAFDNTDVTDYYYMTDGLTVTEKDTDGMQFEISAVDEIGSVDVYADYGNGEWIKSSVYTYQNNGTVYVSDISKDRAFYECMEAQYEAGLISMEEWEDAYTEFSHNFIIEDTTALYETTPANPSANINLIDASTTATASTSTTVTGTLRWELEDGSKLPLRQTKIDLRDKETVGSSLIASTYTDSNGKFSFVFDKSEPLENGGLDLFIRIYTEAKTFEVKQDLTFTYNSLATSVRENVSSGSSITINAYVPYDTSNNVNKSIYVLQGMVVGERFAQAMGMSTDNFIHVLYPFTLNTESAFCWGELADNCYAGIGTNRFNNFDTLIHEYGHFVEVSMGNYGAQLWEMAINIPIHKIDTDHFADKLLKDYAMELTWSESWATAFSQIAQEYYKAEYPNVPGFADVKKDDIDFESPTIRENGGEAQELAVIATLWDMYDSGANESYDNIALGYRFWWEYTTKKGTYTLTDFAKFVDHYYPQNREEIGELMGQHQISPNRLRIRNKADVSELNPPELIWKVNGSSSNPNNRFQVVFFDNYGNYIYSTSYIESTKAYNSSFIYQVSLSDWTQVLKNYGGTFTINIAVRAYHSEEPISGPYISTYAPITLTIHGDFGKLSTYKYTERLVKLDKGEYCDFKISFATSGSKLIQTFGTKDTKITLYASDGTLLKSNNNSGYGQNAYIRYFVWTNTEYTIRIKFSDTSVYGTTKLTIIPAYGEPNLNSAQIDTYADIYAIKNSTKFSLNSYAERNYTRVITYTPPSTGTYTFEIESDFDSYIYVIDPRLISKIVKNVNYNDDDGAGLNPLLTTRLDANVPYLIIYSAIDLNSFTQKSDLKVKISKN